MKTFTLRKLAQLFCLIILTYSYKEAYSSHAQSADITYSCIGGNQYNIRLSFYRDCAGVAAPNSVTINIASASCNQNFNVTLNQIPNTGVDVTPICPGINTQCTGGAYPGVQEWVYEGPVNLPAQCSDWVLSFSLCCRNNAISTINNPGGDNIYVEAHLDNLNFVCNTSPQFSNKPIPFICVNQTYCFNHGAVDPDGDSLVYQLVPPATSPTTNVVFLGGYSATQPLLSAPAVSINPVTGDICMTPTQLDVAVMAVKVSEYRLGEFVGSVIRDIQVRVIACTNNNPTLSGVNGTTNYSAGTCAGQNLTFTIQSSDPDAGQNLTLTWNNAIAGATFTSSAGASPTGTFSWTPTSAQISSQPYCFTVTVADDNCPMNGTQTFSYCITVSGFTINTNSTPANCGASNGTMSVAASGGNFPYTYLWSNGNTSSIVNSIAAGNYTVVVTDATGCAMTSPTVTVAAGALPATITPSVTNVSCFGGNNGAATANVNGGQAPYNYQWSNGNTTPTITGMPAGNYTITVTTANGCTSLTSVQIAQPATALTASTTQTNVTCNGLANGSATVTANGGTGPYFYGWSTNPIQNTATASGLNSGAYAITVMDSEGCVANANVNITQPAAITLSQNTVVPPSCFGGNNGSASVTANGGTGLLSYSWNTNPVSNTSAIANINAGNYTVTVSDANNCAQSFQVPVNDPPQLTANIANFTNVSCFNLNNGNATVNVNGGIAPYTIQWNSSPQQFGTTANGLDGGNYTATIYDAHNCITTTNVTIIEPAALTLATAGGTTMCPGTLANISATANGGTLPHSFHWNNGLGNAASHNVSPAATTTYTVNVTDGNGCATAAQNILVTVNDINTIQFEVAATPEICEGSSGTVLATMANGIGVYTITWNNGLPNTNGPFTVYPTASGYYTATITDACNNSRTESAWMDVNPLPQVQLTPQVLNECGIVNATFFNDLQNTAGSDFSWNLGDGTTSTQEVTTHSYTQSGVYQISLLVTSVQGCTNGDTTTCNVTIRQQTMASFDVIPGNEISIFDPTATFTNNSVNANAYSWDFGDGSGTTQTNPVHEYSTVGSYVVTLIVNNAANCPDTAIRTINVHPEFTFYIPNAFTPDGDGVNDTFFGKGENIEEYEILIFNRWGENIFVSQNINQGWDGTYKGNPEVKQDVYVYKVKIKDSVQGDYHFFEGHVALVK